MGRRKSTEETGITSELILRSKRARIERQTRAVAADVGKARRAGSWSAVMAGHRQLESLGGSLDGVKLDQLVAQARPGEDLLSRTPEQIMEAERRHAEELAPVHLQLYVLAFLRLHPGVFLSTDDGKIEVMGV